MLTKVVFVYLWIFIALAFVALDALGRRIGRSTAVLVHGVLASHLLPVRRLDGTQSLGGR